MALADIIAKIEDDAAAEAAAIIEAAEARAATVVADARARAEDHLAGVLDTASAVARREADTVVVNARLRARDAAVAARRALVEEALSGAADSIARLSDADYARFLAGRIAAVASGGETLAMGAADTGRAEEVLSALRVLAPGLTLTMADSPAPFDRGALLTGSRVRVDLSLNAIVEERRDELELVVARVLFGEGA